MPRVPLTPPVRWALILLRVWLLAMLALLVVRFLRVFQ